MIKYVEKIETISLDEVKDRLKEGAELKNVGMCFYGNSFKQAKKDVDMCIDSIYERLTYDLFEELSGKESELFIKKNDFSDTPEGKTLRWAEDVEIGKGVRTNRKIRTNEGIVEPWKKGMVLLTTEDAVKFVVEEVNNHALLEGTKIIEKGKRGFINTCVFRKNRAYYALAFAKVYPIVFHEKIFVEK